MSGFEFATATRILFGAGKVREIGRLAKPFGSRALVVIGKSAGAIQRVEPVLGALTADGVDYETFSVSGEPTLDTVRAGRKPCELVIAFGGGSVLDTGKAIAALLTNPGDPLEYVEVIGQGRPLTNPVPLSNADLLEILARVW
jgi:alcohol dehydrogenase class IV